METISRKVQFFINAILSGGKAGAITTSSEYLVESVLKHIKEPLSNAVEYGPGDGVMTKALLKILSPQGKLVVIESNPEFVKILRKIEDSRIQIIEGNVQNVIDQHTENLKGADLVVSSIPFSFLTPLERDRVIERTHSLLRPGGSCIIFHQYSTLIKKSLEKYFKTVSVSFELRNIFPCFILFAKKA